MNRTTTNEAACSGICVGFHSVFFDVKCIVEIHFLSLVKVLMGAVLPNLRLDPVLTTSSTVC